MRKLLIAAAGIAAMAAFTTPSSAQGISIDGPGVGVRIGDHHRHYRDWDGPRVYHGRGFRDRDVYLRGSSCRTVTIRNDDGFVKRIRRCD